MKLLQPYRSLFVLKGEIPTGPKRDRKPNVNVFFNCSVQSVGRSLQRAAYSQLVVQGSPGENWEVLNDCKVPLRWG